ncbi:uncharacterized protein AB675_1277 [Cyphellophora attinorum]|uniref:HOOK N-terminal domain-containing protein n=1 Tax=Cyphellophora attinorum TaxID=1664694 RepID=A0A0N0NIF1_9EURO|nr:uncharacterized protein AB675_1277 [Phialophora attinorum]KPI35761.1 hypothetical protein AB675_1277 [Phialophora attinorum]
MTTDEDTAAGLIAWLNSLDVAGDVQTISDLNDGDVIWKVLQRIDALSFPGRLPEEANTDQWIPRWNNLKHINDALTMFLAEDCGQRLPLSSGAPDLKAIAQHASLHDTVALLKLVVVAAINCNDRIEYLTQMQDLNATTQEVLMRTAQEASELEPDDASERPAYEEPPPSSSPPPKTPPSRNGRVHSDFEAEERLGRVLADNQRIAHEKRDVEKQLDEAYARYERLQESLDKTQDELKESNDRLSAVLAGKAEGTNRDARNETVIAQLESRVSSADAEIEELRKSNELLKIRVEKTQKLQDDYDEIKIERDQLARKANAADKYKQKLEASHDLERENQNLRQRVTELQSQVRDSDSSTMAKSDLRRENEELQKLLSMIEQDYNETSDMKKRLEFDYQTLEARYQDRGEDLRKHQQTIEDLQSRLQNGDEEGQMPIASDTAKALEDDAASEEAEDTPPPSEKADDFAESEARLTAALVNGESERTDDGITEDELRAIMSAMRAQHQAGTASEKEKAQKKLIIALEKGRSKNNELKDHIKKQAELIQQLQAHAPPTAEKEAERPPTPPPKDIEPEVRAPSPTESEAEHDLDAAKKVIVNLRRELDLMTSAWYEQNRRIASSGMVTLRNRASPEPRSFLGRQRKMVDAVALGGMAR